MGKRPRDATLPPLQHLSQVLAISVTELITGERSDQEWILEEVRKLEVQIVELKTKLAARI